jgi:hypothetical protein
LADAQIHRDDGEPIDAGPLRAVFGVASDDVWVGAYDGSLYHWNGDDWEAFTPAEGAHWLRMRGTSSDDIWVYGHEDRIYHFDGSDWTQVETGTTNNSISAAWGAAADDVWFVSLSGARLHWNGEKLE